MKRKMTMILMMLGVSMTFFGFRFAEHFGGGRGCFYVQLRR